MGATVLIADEQAAFVETYRRWLLDTFDIRTARNGQEVLDQLGPDIDLVLLERRFTDLTDEEILQTIEDRAPDCRVIMLTSIEPAFDIIEFDIDAYLLKPVSKQELRAVIEQVIELPRYHPGRARRYALLSKKTVLEGVKPEAELAGSEAFRNLVVELEGIKADLEVFDPPEYPPGPE